MGCVGMKSSFQAKRCSPKRGGEQDLADKTMSVEGRGKCSREATA